MPQHFFSLSSVNFFNSGYVEIIASLFATLLLFLYLFLVFISYRQILVPEPFYRNSVSSKYNCIDLAHQYLKFKGINNLPISKSLTHTHPFGNYRNGTVYINDLPLFKPPYQLTGMGLDYVLGRLFLVSQQRLKQNNYWFYRMIGYWLPAVCFILFWILMILNLIFGVIWSLQLSIIYESDILYFLYKYKIILILLTVIWIFYFVTTYLSGKIKEAIENDYELDIIPFVKKNYLDLYSDFIIARRYSRSIKHTYCLGIGWLLKNNYRYLGPFGIF